MNNVYCGGPAPELVPPPVVAPAATIVPPTPPVEAPKPS